MPDEKIMTSENLVPVGEIHTAMAVEPGGAPAPSLSLGSWATGIIASGDESDYYNVNLTQGTTYDFYAGGITLDDTVLTLYNTLGSQVASNDDGGWGQDSFIDDFTALSTGSYQLKVDSYGTHTGSYVVGAHVDYNYDQIDT